jgi:serine/threonine protein phosphatase PrpC
MSSGAMTHVGAVRTINEDAFLTTGRLCLVADGMGGHEAGEIASGLVTELFGDALKADGDLELLDLEPLISSINQSIRSYGTEHEALGMGTTVVGAVTIANGGGQSVVVFNVGDSRCYRLMGSDMRQLTTDHSHVQELIDSGEISQVEARTHPLRNVVTRALGADADVHADYIVLADENCRLLLCSDGLSSEVGFDEIASLASHSDPAIAAGRLIDAALRGAARDNITAVVVDLEFPGAVAEDDTVPNLYDEATAAEITAPREPVPSEAKPDRSDTLVETEGSLERDEH